MPREAHATPRRTRQAERQAAFDHLRWRGLGMTRVYRRQVLEPFQPLQLEAAFVVVELGACHAALAAGAADVPQRFSELEHTQPLVRDLLWRVLAHTASSSQSGRFSLPNGESDLTVTDEA